MTHENTGGKKPREFWITKRNITNEYWVYETPSYHFNHVDPPIHVREVIPESKCTNCETLEDQLYKTEESSANQYQKVQRLKAQVAVCKEALELIKIETIFLLVCGYVLMFYIIVWAIVYFYQE